VFSSGVMNAFIAIHELILTTAIIRVSTKLSPFRKYIEDKHAEKGGQRRSKVENNIIDFFN
jgi:hypothetical protein